MFRNIISKKWSPINIITAIGMLFRILFLIIGVWLDKDSLQIGVKYTDVDYFVFSDAGQVAYNGGSPYERPTYRYPPILAFLCIPNYAMGLPLFGKLLFTIADALITKCVYEVVLELELSKVPQASENYHENAAISKKYAQWWAFIWAFNPLSTIICTRGNADSLTNALILLTLSNLLHWRRTFCNYYLIIAGGVFGLAVHLRLYPIIYIPAICWYVVSHQPRFMSIFTFATAAMSVVFFLGAVSYSLYGFQYLDNAYMYHSHRKDPRHNFSVFFLDIYLHVSEQKVANIGHIANHNVSSYLVAAYHGASAVLRTFLPQIILLLVSAQRLARSNLGLCFLVQTMLFVAFNKVATAQYFTWYLCLLPIATPRHVGYMLGFTAPEPSANTEPRAQALQYTALLTQRWVVLGAFFSILISMCLWLHRAYALEILGESVFLDVALSGAVLLAAHVFAILVLLRVFTK